MKLMLLSVAVMSCAVASAEPICWNGDVWDNEGAPKGALLTENPGWWGRSVFTGVNYSYEEGPTNPKDTLKRDKEIFGSRLIDGKVNGDWNVPVGKSGRKPLVAVFDFKRPCAFTEVVLFASRSPNAHGMVEISPDGSTWTTACTFQTVSQRTRLKMDVGSTGRFMRLSFKADSGITYLDEVLVWGEGEVSERYPEAIADINPGNAFVFTEENKSGVKILPMTKPTLDNKPSGETPEKIELLMARNEMEVRYFAVVNSSATHKRISLTPPSMGAKVDVELSIGGVVRMTRPPVKLTEKQIIDLLITDLSKVNSSDTNKLDVLPFFSVDALPERNFARRYLANPEQVVGFPRNVPLAPGEGCVIMLRIKTDSARSGKRKGFLRAGKVRLPVELDVKNVMLPDVPLWIHAYSPFTRQFPFESETRVKKDIERLAALGVSSCYGLPEPGTKPAILKKMVPHTICAARGWVSGRIFGGTYSGKWTHFDTTNRVAIETGVHDVVQKARELGLQPEDYCVFLPDEPGRKNAALVGEMAQIIKRAEPSLQIYMNPCFWERGFPPEKAIYDHLIPYYNAVIDISCPIMNLVRSDNQLTKDLWTAKRRVNAQYIHPATRAGRKIAWSSFRNGLNGFGYYCYYSPQGNPWDIRTWKQYDYRYQMVFPLCDDVAVTPLYELMREAWEDYRLLTALRQSGKNELLQKLLESYDRAQDYEDIENMPNTSDFQALRDTALSSF